MTAAGDLNTSAEVARDREAAEGVDVRTWCFDCYDRREPWVLVVLGDLGVGFRHVVLEEADACRSCKAELPRGLHAVRVTIPMRPPTHTLTSEGVT